MDARLTYTVRSLCFGPGRIKTKLNHKHKFGSLPGESKIITGCYCISLALHHQQQDIVQVTARWHCAEGYSEDFTWRGTIKMFILIFCNIKKPPWESRRNLVIWKVTRLSSIPESWKRSFSFTSFQMSILCPFNPCWWLGLRGFFFVLLF